MGFTLIVSLAACTGGGSGSNGGSNEEVVDQLGDFSYNFKIDDRCSGSCDEFKLFESCETAQKFTSKRAYCTGLRDAALNRGCAREKRKREYLANCTANFDEFNVGGISSSGGDERVGSCDWDAPAAPTGTAWCESLKNESKHGYCRWDDRRIRFKQYGCQGSFSELRADLLMKDSGAVLVTNFYRERAINYVTYKIYRKTFKVSPTTSSVLSVSAFHLDEGTCEANGKAKIVGTLMNINSGALTPFNPVTDKLPLPAGSSYAIIVDVTNDGLCKRFHFDYDVEVR